MDLEEEEVLFAEYGWNTGEEGEEHDAAVDHGGGQRTFVEEEVPCDIGERWFVR